MRWLLFILVFIHLSFAQKNSEPWLYYGGIAALYGLAEILPEHDAWLASDSVKQAFPPRETIKSTTPVIYSLSLMTIITNPLRDNFSSRPDGGNNLLGLVDAMLFEHAVTSLVKNLVQRERPNNEREKVSFWSGHAAVSFTSAHYISRYLHDYSALSNSAKNVSSLALYSLASYVAWTRVDDLQHHWSDIIIGSLWGILASNYIYRIRNEGLHHLFEGNTARNKPSVQLQFGYRF